ncbi:maturation of Asn-linked oligosaccharides protein [Gryganskiella cystojenkinii]|nr:maturation of Asn-linked oligosaccharides protein [Gryganskiella cystojenkinii]
MRLSVLATLVLLHTALAQIQRPNLKQPSTGQVEAAKVKELFQNTYGAYVKRAFGNDTLTPVTGTIKNDHHGWGLTIIASMSTMYVMGLNDLFADAVAFVATVDFSKVPADSPLVAVSDTSTRYLGGLLSAYELSQKKNPVLLQKAQQLGDKLVFAWVGEKDVPFSSVNFLTNTASVENTHITIAEATGMLLEFVRLSNFTGNTTYANLALKSLTHVARNTAPLPGLPSLTIDVSIGAPVGDYVTFGGGASDYFYGLLRFATQSNTPEDTLYRDSWNTAADSAMRNLRKTSTVGNHIYFADFDNDRKIRDVSSQLACFTGGDWVLAGKAFDNQTYEDIGLQLIDACYDTYASTETHLGPEAIAYVSSDSSLPPPPDQNDFYLKNGFYITVGEYVQRPEVPQSNFYAWRATGDEKYISRAESILDALLTYTMAPFGMAQLSDVSKTDEGNKMDDTNASLFSGVLMYLYLTFDDPKNYSLDNYIWSMEGHPFTR